MDCFWIHNTEATLPELRRASEGVAMLPLASIESHGPHLPVGSDTLVAEYVLKLVAEMETVAILPVLTYSSVIEARMLLGAVNIRSEVLMDYVETICDEVYRNGFDKVVLMHGHGGNVILDGAFLKRVLEREKPYSVYSIGVLAGRWGEVAPMFDTECGHACAFETSLNMAACPDLVRLDLLGEKTFPNQPTPQVGSAQTPVEWTAAHPEMAVGVPQKASREKGEKIARIWAEGIVSDLKLIKKDTICRSAMESFRQRANGLRGTGD